ncbi:tRNA (adenosine(37)-N6)-threonylcarbamoyltransferase complex ATPase subunit type 1 TsaE [Alphaproteobacteria bacterium]|nr:tRNA (adenosine(37)-N6)-threonylcarbamoyltransferase complex ATPase subunit type 1 TsaE [Alphaproteobacteria bacterium]
MNENNKYNEYIHERIYNIDELKLLAKNISVQIKKNDVILLKGQLGSGKTTFVKFLISALSRKEVVVQSPTFNLVLTYNFNDFTLWHFDLYRLTNLEDVWDLGIDEAISNGVSVIEWPEIIQEVFQENYLEILFSHIDLNESRMISIKPYGDWTDRIRKIKQVIK